MNNIFFNEALNQAKKAYKRNEVPIGAVIVKNNKIIAKAYNKKNINNLCFLHAEILAIKKACKKIANWNLIDCEMYVTLKPCGMCEKIIKESHLKKVYYLCDKLSFKKEYDKTEFLKFDNDLIEDEYKILLNNFFKDKRRK